MEEYCTFCTITGKVPIPIQSLVELDDLLCEIISGNQGSFTPHPRSVTMAEIAREILKNPLSQTGE